MSAVIVPEKKKKARISFSNTVAILKTCIIMHICLYKLLFHPRFVCPIPTALYHPARIRVDISLISPSFSRRLISWKMRVISWK